MRHAPTLRLSRKQRIKRREGIFGSFSRVIAHLPHRVAVLRQQETDRIISQGKPPRNFGAAKKREGRRLIKLRASAKAIVGSNRKPRKGPTAEHRLDIARREAKRIKHEERTAVRS